MVLTHVLSSLVSCVFFPFRDLSYSLKECLVYPYFTQDFSRMTWSSILSDRNFQFTSSIHSPQTTTPPPSLMLFFQGYGCPGSTCQIPWMLLQLGGGLGVGELCLPHAPSLLLLWRVGQNSTSGLEQRPLDCCPDVINIILG